MKILMLSIFAPHFFNWTEQLKDSGHEIIWLDLFDSNTRVKQIDFAEQIIGWRYKIDYPGRYFLKKNAPILTSFINIFNERNFQVQLEKQIQRTKPDVIHSFVMYLGGVPALEVMKRNPAIKWIYTAWGSDMFYYRKQPKHLEGIKKTLPLMDYMFADCYRDYQIARKNGYKGKFLGVFPGGGGIDIRQWKDMIEPFEKKRFLLIKGYQDLHGKCIEVLKALLELHLILDDYEIVVFGAPAEVNEFINTSPLKSWSNFQVYGKLPHPEVMALMGKAKIYIGNSTSDGMPNTLLEAIVMEAFPIQSNPGGATAELIKDGQNGFLINNPENVEQIKTLIFEALRNLYMVKSGINYNNQYVKPTLERDVVKKQVLEKYDFIAQNLPN